MCTLISGRNNNINKCSQRPGRGRILCLDLLPLQYTKLTHELRTFLMYRFLADKYIQFSSSSSGYTCSVVLLRIPLCSWLNPITEPHLGSLQRKILQLGFSIHSSVLQRCSVSRRSASSNPEMDNHYFGSS